MKTTREESKHILAPGHSYSTVTEHITALILKNKPGKGWYLGVGLAFCGLMLLSFAVAVLLRYGVGIWGINIPVGWGFAIINFVWWVGIGHAGTFISAILLLVRQQWRTSINRFAEAMTLFAVACAGMFPLLHVGRQQLAYWLFPYPNTLGIWPQFRSPLVWDVFAVSTYITVSFVFWFIGLIPDFAVLRDRAVGKVRKMAYGFFALGWRGSAVHWFRYEIAYNLLAGLAAPLVLSVHTIVSLDFAVSLIPGWHTTIFPPYFVAGAIFSGFAMVLTLAIPLRYFYNLEDFITLKHLENAAKVIIATGLIVAYGYGMEIFFAWYSGSEAERFMIYNRMTGPYAGYYWSLIACNVLAPQFLWFKKIRTNLKALFVISIVVNIGMWLERFIIVITSLHRDYIPASWSMYHPTVFDWALYIGTFGLFFFLFFFFIRFLPVIAISEMQKLVDDTQNPHSEGGHH